MRIPTKLRWLRGARPMVPALLTALVGAALHFGLKASGAMDVQSDRVPLRLAFSAREALGRSPEMDPRLKVITWDDKTTDLLTAWGAESAIDMPLASWRRVFEWVASAKPRAIVVDKLFENPLGLAEAPAFVAATASMGTPLIAGAYLTSEMHRYRSPVPRDRPEHRASSLATRGEQTEDPKLPIKHAYGPHARIVEAFSFIGHLGGGDWGNMRLFEDTGDGNAVPHVALGLAYVDSRDLSWPERLANVGLPQPRSLGDRTLVNLLNASTVSSRALSMGWVLSEIASRRPVSRIDAGDTVLIIPSAYTGGTDFKETPLGKMMGGSIQASAVNSALTRRWLTELDGGYLLDAFAVLAGASMAMLLAPLAFWSAMAAVLTVVVTASLAAFAYGDVFVHWLSPAMALAGVGGLVAIERQAALHLRSRLLQQEIVLGHTVQSLFLPEVRRSATEDYEFSIVFQPHGPMSGDWYQMHLPEGGGASAAMLAIGDVVGKGPKAALSTAVLASEFRRLATTWPLDASQVVLALNKAMLRTFRGQQNTTMSLAILDPGSVELCAVAMTPWLHLRRSGKLETLKIPTVELLGHRSIAEASTIKVTLEPGEVLIAFTDGVIDGSKGRRKFRLMIEARWTDGPATVATTELFDELEAMARRAGEDDIMPDDFTLLMIRRAVS